MSDSRMISVDEGEHATDIRRRLKDEILGCGSRDSRVTVEMAREGDISLIRLVFDSDLDDESRDEILYCVANVLSDAIINSWEPTLVRDILDREYGFLKSGERMQVLQQVNGDMTPGAIMTRHKIRRKGFVLDQLHGYLRTNDRLSLEGFVAFRLREYVNALNQHVEESVNDVLVAREYEQWTQLLRDFSLPEVNSRDLVHVLFDPDNGWSLCDETGEVLQDRLLDEYQWWYSERGMDHPDLLITGLIVLRPQRIILHDPLGIADHAGVVSSLEEIFLERLKQCHGCPLCDERS